MHRTHWPSRREWYEALQAMAMIATIAAIIGLIAGSLAQRPPVFVATQSEMASGN